MNQENRSNITRHLLFWAIVFFFEVSRSQFNFVNYSWETLYHDFMESMLNFPVLLAASYFTTLFLIPRYLARKNYGAFAALLILSAVFFIFAMRIILRYVTLPLFYPAYVEKYPDFFQFNVFQHFFYIYSVVLFMVLMKAYEDYSEMQRKKEKLEKENVESRLSLLRSQVNPHFLFNTLNNISTLSRMDPSATSDAIQQLAGIMRYMMNEATRDSVEVAKEILLIRDYIQLQELRLSRGASVDFTVSGDSANLNVPPMLLLPFIENAFKHGRKDGPPPIVSISVSIENDHLRLIVSNRIRDEKVSIPAESSGIGIENVRNRLELLFPEKHRLDITRDGEMFTVNLTISTDEHHYLHRSG
jgi:sensor histidine kinase YesM